LSFKAAEWTTKYINDLNDSAFAFIAPGGKKDAEGKTVPRTLRNLPYKDANGKIDLPHLRNAMARVTHTNLSKGQQKNAHDVLLRAYKQVGMSHPPCSVPGCKGYEPSKKKSMLCDAEAFRAYRESWLQTNNKRAVVIR
jgi:hypothetical protein